MGLFRQFCSDVSSPEHAEDVANGEYSLCESLDAPLRQRCNAAPMASGGTTVIGEEIIFMDLRDTVCQVTEALAQAASSNWISPATSTTGVTVVLYNGELGVYSVVDLKFDFESRGGKIVTHAEILTAPVPLRTAEWFVYEALMVASLLVIVVGEIEELCESILACGCFKAGGYFRDPTNILDWSVVIIFSLQPFFWIMLEVRLGRWLPHPARTASSPIGQLTLHLPPRSYGVRFVPGTCFGAIFRCMLSP